MTQHYSYHTTAGGAIALLMLASCTSSGERPDAAIGKAEASIESAEQSGARQYGAAELDTARSKLTLAKVEAEQGDRAEALRLAEQAALDAQFAGAKGQTGKSREAAAQLRDSTETLKQEANQPPAGAPGSRP